MEYADVIKHGCFDSESDFIEFVQYEASKILTSAMKGSSKARVLAEMGWGEMKTRRLIVLYYKIVNGLTPSYLKEHLLARVYERTQYSLRSADNFLHEPNVIEGPFFFLPQSYGMILTIVLDHRKELVLLR